MAKFNPPVQECITVTQATKYAACSRTGLLAALRRGTLKGVKVGNRWLTTRDAVDEYFRRDRMDWLNKHQREERAAKIRAAWTCCRCGCKQGRGLQTMTIYYKDRDEENQTQDNMIVLCWQCYFFAMKKYHPQQLLLPGMDLPEWIL
jgi:excisionase family DNA binding protein